MANVRPSRKSKFTRVDDDVNEEPELINPRRDEQPTGSFFNDYDQMHSKSFNNMDDKSIENKKIKGLTGGDLESLVKTLASLQFTTKGKIDADGKVEIVFCSPEPIVMEEKPVPEVRFVKSDAPQRMAPHHSHRHKERKGRFLM